MPILIRPFTLQDRTRILALSLRAWTPVFAEMRRSVPDYVYDAFYPHGWRARQTGDIEAYLETDANNVLVAVSETSVAGWVGLRLHPADRMGEIYILAVDPVHQRSGVASALIDAAFARMREAGMSIAMVETGDDPGHTASRATYENAGFERWPVARYFRRL